MPLQRNETDHPLDVPAAAVTVQPGDTLDWPVPVIGLVPADPEPDPEPVEPEAVSAIADTPPAAPSPRKPRRHAAKADEETAA